MAQGSFYSRRTALQYLAHHTRTMNTAADNTCPHGLVLTRQAYEGKDLQETCPRSWAKTSR
jgi:hypothetical protein